MDLHDEIFTKGNSWPSLKNPGDFISDVIRIDLHYHLLATDAISAQNRP